MWSLLGWKEDSLLKPQPVTVTVARIPADGTPPHLLSLSTISDSKATDSFLFHVPDLHPDWGTEQAYEYRDIQRIDLLRDSQISLSLLLQQKHDLQSLLRATQHQHTRQ